MLTKTSPGTFRHRDGDTYRIGLTTEGTGKREIAVLGGTRITLPKTIQRSDYTSLKPSYQINIIFTFTVDAEEDAKYTLTFVDSSDNVVDRRVIKRPAGSLPSSVSRTFRFRIGG